MSRILIIWLLLVSCSCLAGKPDTAGLKVAVSDLNLALIRKDSAVLKKLLHKKVTYGHSNGWVETKREVIEDLYNGKLVYNKIDQGNLEIVKEENTASVRTTADIEVLLNGKPIQMKLHVLQVWIKEKKGWLLLSRQSTKI